MIKTKTRKLLVLALSLLFAFSLISFVVAKPVNADASVETRVVMKPTAEVRLEVDYDEDGIERTGIRFTGLVDKTLEFSEPDAITGLFDKTTDKYAGIIVGKGEIAAEELTHDDDVLDAPAARWHSEKDTDTQKAFNAVVYGIPESDYGKLMTARAYYWNGTEYEYSDNVCVRSIAQVASTAIIEDNPVDEDLEMLRDFVDGANPVLKLGDTVLNASEKDAVVINEIELMAATKTRLTVEPAGIAYEAYADVDEGKNLSVSGEYIVTGNSGNVPQLVIIDLGSKTYYINVTITEWIDTEMEAGVYAEYNESAYTTTFEPISSNGVGTITYLNQAEAETELGDVAEAENGVIRWDVVKYRTVRLHLQKPIDMESSVNGFSIRLKTNCPNLGQYLAIRFPNGEFVKSYDVAGLAWENLGEYAGMYYTANEWYDLNFTKQAYEKMDAWSNANPIEYIDLQFYGTPEGGVFDYNCVTYFDKIYDTPVWADEDMAEGVYSAFDAKEYIKTVTIGGSNTVTYLDQTQAKEELGNVPEAENGVIKVDVKDDCQYLRIDFQKPVDMSKAIGFSIRMKMGFESTNLVKVRFPGTTSNVEMYSVRGLTDATKDDGYEAGEWFDLKFMQKYYINTTAWTNPLESIEFYICAQGQAIYFDQVGAISDAKAGYLADFDEVTDVKNYTFAHPSWYANPLTIETNVGGAEGGVLAFNSVTSATMNIYPQNAVNGSKVSKIIVRVFVPTIESTDAQYAKARFNMGVNSTATAKTQSPVSLNKEQGTHKYISETDSNKMYKFIERGSWVEIEYDVTGVLSDRPIDRISFNRHAQPGANADIFEGEGAWYIDWIKYVLA